MFKEWESNREVFIDKFPKTYTNIQIDTTYYIRKAHKNKRTRLKPPHPVPSTTTRGADDVDVVVDDVSVAVVDVVAVVSLMVVFVVVDDDSVRTEVIRQDHDGALKLRMMNNERDMMTYV